MLMVVSDYSLSIIVFLILLLIVGAGLWLRQYRQIIRLNKERKLLAKEKQRLDRKSVV